MARLHVLERYHGFTIFKVSDMRALCDSSLLELVTAAATKLDLLPQVNRQL